jgi:protoporphyrinogen oxidase
LEQRSENFATILQKKLGPTICESFYFPYAFKIWGCDPHELSPTQARRRVSADSFGKLLRKAFGRLPGVRPLGFRHFLYPRNGYGQISEALAEGARSLGAEFLLGWKVEAVKLPRAEGKGCQIVASRGDQRRTLEGDFVWSTIPITALATLVSPPPPAAVAAAGRKLRYRAMLLVYVTLEVDSFSEYDAHYFPGSDIRLSRLSEPKNYAAAEKPRGRTTLCAEIPCSPADDVWQMTDEELGAVVVANASSAGIPMPTPSQVQVARLQQAYPVYDLEYENAFSALDSWLDGLPLLLSFGRQGLFAHDNTHHALYMAYCAADCLGSDGFDRIRWSKYRREFEEHVVED